MGYLAAILLLSGSCVIAGVVVGMRRRRQVVTLRVNHLAQSYAAAAPSSDRRWLWMTRAASVADRVFRHRMAAQWGVQVGARTLLAIATIAASAAAAVTLGLLRVPGLLAGAAIVGAFV